jgi:hypothetical protein
MSSSARAALTAGHHSSQFLDRRSLETKVVSSSFGLVGFTTLFNMRNNLKQELVVFKSQKGSGDSAWFLTCCGPASSQKLQQQHAKLYQDMLLGS